MKSAALLLGLAGALAAVPAQASEELAKKHACFACHAVDKKLVGPVLQGRRGEVPRRQGAQKRSCSTR